jgi:hypothetical protein
MRRPRIRNRARRCAYDVLRGEILVTREEASGYRRRIDRTVGDREPLAVLERTADELASIIAAQPVEALRRRPEAGGWSPIEILGHLVDSELAYGFRLRAMLFDDEPTYPGWDQERWVRGQHYQDADPTTLIDQFRLLRTLNLPLWRGLQSEDLERGGTHARRGRETVGEMLRITAGHDLLHLEQIRRCLES